MLDQLHQLVTQRDSSRFDYWELAIAIARSIADEQYRYLLSVAIEATIQSATFASYSTHVNIHLIPRIGSIPLQKLSAGQINRLYSELRKNGRARGSGELSPNSVRRIHATLHRALRDAVRWGYLSRNPAMSADPPRQVNPETLSVKAWQVETLSRCFSQA